MLCSHLQQRDSLSREQRLLCLLFWEQSGGSDDAQQCKAVEAEARQGSLLQIPAYSLGTAGWGDFAMARRAICLSFSPPAVVLAEVLPPPEKRRSVKWLQQTGTGRTGVSLHWPCCSQRGFGTDTLREDWQQGGQLCLRGRGRRLTGSEAST